MPLLMLAATPSLVYFADLIIISWFSNLFLTQVVAVSDRQFQQSLVAQFCLQLGALLPPVSFSSMFQCLVIASFAMCQNCNRKGICSQRSPGLKPLKEIQVSPSSHSLLSYLQMRVFLWLSTSPN